jgi:hypothetical protein
MSATKYFIVFGTKGIMLFRISVPEAPKGGGIDRLKASEAIKAMIIPMNIALTLFPIASPQMVFAVANCVRAVHASHIYLAILNHCVAVGAGLLRR